LENLETQHRQQRFNGCAPVSVDDAQVGCRALQPGEGDPLPVRRPRGTGGTTIGGQPRERALSPIEEPDVGRHVAHNDGHLTAVGGEARIRVSRGGNRELFGDAPPVHQLQRARSRLIDGGHDGSVQRHRHLGRAVDADPDALHDHRRITGDPEAPGVEGHRPNDPIKVGVQQEARRDIAGIGPGDAEQSGHPASRIVHAEL
jgi:hypothetical protein